MFLLRNSYFASLIMLVSHITTDGVVKPFSRCYSIKSMNLHQKITIDKWKDLSIRQNAGGGIDRGSDTRGKTRTHKKGREGITAHPLSVFYNHIPGRRLCLATITDLCFCSRLLWVRFGKRKGEELCVLSSVVSVGVKKKWEEEGD